MVARTSSTELVDTCAVPTRNTRLPATSSRWTVRGRSGVRVVSAAVIAGPAHMACAASAQGWPGREPTPTGAVRWYRIQAVVGGTTRGVRLVVSAELARTHGLASVSAVPFRRRTGVAGLGTFGATMSRRLSVYLLLAALLSIGSVTSWIALGVQDARAELALIRGEIAVVEWSTARARLDSLAGSFGGRRRALAGLAAIEALTADDDRPLPTRVEAHDLAYFPIGLLLQRGLAEERYDGCLRLIELLRRVGAPTFPELEAAALLEQGRPDL